eukprot:29885-Pelagococcus_subviridis.AAC.3
MRRERKSSRIGVHNADGVVWGPVYRTRLSDGGVLRGREEVNHRVVAVGDAEGGPRRDVRRRPHRRALVHAVDYHDVFVVMLRVGERQALGDPIFDRRRRRGLFAPPEEPGRRAEAKRRRRAAAAAAAAASSRARGEYKV